MFFFLLVIFLHPRWVRTIEESQQDVDVSSHLAGDARRKEDVNAIVLVVMFPFLCISGIIRLNICIYYSPLSADLGEQGSRVTNWAFSVEFCSRKPFRWCRDRCEIMGGVVVTLWKVVKTRIESRCITMCICNSHHQTSLVLIITNKESDIRAQTQHPV